MVLNFKSNITVSFKEMFSLQSKQFMVEPLLFGICTSTKSLFAQCGLTCQQSFSDKKNHKAKILNWRSDYHFSTRPGFLQRMELFVFLTLLNVCKAWGYIVTVAIVLKSLT